MLKKLAIAAVCVGFAPFAFAQDCSTPIQIQSNNANGLYAPSGATTCGAGNPFPNFPGSISSPQPDIVHSFIAQGANATITLDTSGSPLVPGLVLLDACDPNAANIMDSDTGGAGTTVSISASGLTDGQEYFLVVTTGPGEGAADSNCGAYAGTITDILPVELQKASVE